MTKSIPFLELRFNQIIMYFIYSEFEVIMGSRTQILKCKVLLKDIEFDFPLCKELQIDWKLPKYQFSIFFVIRKVKNRI